MSHFSKKVSSQPITKTGADGSAKRNILRKGGAAVYRKENTTGRRLQEALLTKAMLIMLQYVTCLSGMSQLCVDCLLFPMFLLTYVPDRCPHYR